MSKDLEQAIKEQEQAIASTKAEIKLNLKQLPEEIKQRLEPLIGTEEFNNEAAKIQEDFESKIKELENKLDEIGRD